MSKECDGMPAPDEQIVEGVLQGDTDLFGDLIKAHRKTVYAIALATTGDDQHAEDLTQACFVEAFRRLGELREDHRFGSWLYAIARNRCRDWLRRKPRDPVLFGDPSNLPQTDAPELPANPEDLAVAAARDQAVRAAVASLPEKYRVVVVLRYAGQLDHAETAEALGLTIPAVTMRWQRAKQMLRERLRDVVDNGDEG